MGQIDGQFPHPEGACAGADMQSKESKGARAREGGQRPLGPEDATENGRALLRRFVPGRVAAVKDLRENITKRVEAMSAALEELTPARSAAPRLPLLVYAGGSAGFLGLPMRPVSRRRRRAGRPRRLSIRHLTRGRSEGRAVAAYPQPGRAEVRFVVRDAPRLSAKDACVRVGHVSVLLLRQGFGGQFGYQGRPDYSVLLPIATSGSL